MHYAERASETFAQHLDIDQCYHLGSMLLVRSATGVMNPVYMNSMFDWDHSQFMVESSVSFLPFFSLPCPASLPFFLYLCLHAPLPFLF